jgi:hypothetical protein
MMDESRTMQKAETENKGIKNIGLFIIAPSPLPPH